MPDIHDDALPESLYHYTDVGGLHGILKSNSLYATHVAYLNDSQELLYGVEMGREELMKLVMDTPNEVKTALASGGRPLGGLLSFMAHVNLMTIAREMGKERQSLRVPIGPYVTCLSEERDRLSQWRGYGKGGGYAIRFDAGELRDSVRQRRTARVQRVASASRSGTAPIAEARFIRVDYNSERQRSDVKDYLIRYIIEHADQIKSARTAEDRNAILLPLFDALVIRAARLKSPGFEEENEYRIATFDVPEEELFSPSPMGIIPRTLFSFDPSCIREVLIGPGLQMDTREFSVRCYLDTTYEGKKQKYPGVEVTPSKTPYRGD